MHVEDICTVCIKLSDGMVRELNDVRYVPQLKKNMISVGSLRRETLEKGVLKRFNGSLLF